MLDKTYDNILEIEIADTPYLMERGLMFRKVLDTNSGMLFKFPRPQKLSFWGMNTYIPLDIAFVSPENTIVKISTIKPFNLSSIASDSDCTYAIETNEGYFAKAGVEEGDKIIIDKDEDNYPIIKFMKVTEKE